MGWSYGLWPRDDVWSYGPVLDMEVDRSPLGIGIAAEDSEERAQLRNSMELIMEWTYDIRDKRYG
jgi:hypothetical protein